MPNKRKAQPPRKILPKADKPYEKRKKKNEDKKRPPDAVATGSTAMETTETPTAMTPQKQSTPAPKTSSPAALPVSTCAPRPRGPQCYKCQRWGHKSYDCTGDTHCVKCSLGHRASECPKRAEDPCCCFNCSGPHPASYRGCPAAPKSRRRRKPRPRPRSKMVIPGIPENKVEKLLTKVCKMLTLKDFLTEEQRTAIALDEDELTAPKEASSQTMEIICKTTCEAETQTDADKLPTAPEDKGLTPRDAEFVAKIYKRYEYDPSSRKIGTGAELYFRTRHQLQRLQGDSRLHAIFEDALERCKEILKILTIPEVNVLPPDF